MTLRLKKIAFLSQLEDMEAYVTQYEDIKNKVDHNESHHNYKTSKYNNRNYNNSNKNTYYNNGVNHYKQPQQQNVDYINNFLVPPNVSNGNGFGFNPSKQQMNPKYGFGMQNHQQDSFLNAANEFNSYNPASQQQPQLYMQQQNFDNIYTQQYPAYQQQSLYSEYYKSDPANNGSGFVSSNSTGSSNIKQVTPPLTYHSNTPASSTSSYDNVNPEVSANATNTNSLLNSYNKLWTNNSNSSVWS